MDKKIIIIGPFCSGTNLIEKILKVNNKIFCNDKIYWKHIIDLPRLTTLCKIPNVIIVIMYRNLYNWINSVSKTKYDFVFNIISSKLIFMPHRNFNKKKIYDNVIDVYNNYYKNYMFLLNNYSNVVFIDYYKLLENDSLNYLKTKLEKYNIVLPDENKYLSILNSKSKNHGHCVNSSKQALENYMPDYLKIKNLIDTNENLYKYVDTNIINYFEK